MIFMSNSDNLESVPLGNSAVDIWARALYNNIDTQVDLFPFVGDREVRGFKYSYIPTAMLGQSRLGLVPTDKYTMLKIKLRKLPLYKDFIIIAIPHIGGTRVSFKRVQNLTLFAKNVQTGQTASINIDINEDRTDIPICRIVSLGEDWYIQAPFYATLPKEFSEAVDKLREDEVARIQTRRLAELIVENSAAVSAK